MKIGPTHIPGILYKKILEVLPVACVDLVIVHGRKFLLGKRINEPACGQWFFIGGRIYKGELLEDAARRHIETEIDIKKFKIKKLLGVEETIFKTSAQGPSSHTINIVYLVEASSWNVHPKNKENSEMKWFSKIDSRWHPYVKHTLRRTGFQK